MVNKNIITTFVAVFLVAGSLFISMPQNANAGTGIPPANPGCCQVLSESGFDCGNTEFGGCVVPIGAEVIGFFEGESCNVQTGFCSGFEPENIRDVPTLSEWGLIAMAGILGVVGFMVMRRKRVSA